MRTSLAVLSRFCQFYFIPGGVTVKRVSLCLPGDPSRAEPSRAASRREPPCRAVPRRAVTVFSVFDFVTSSGRARVYSFDNEQQRTTIIEGEGPSRPGPPPTSPTLPVCSSRSPLVISSRNRGCCCCDIRDVRVPTVCLTRRVSRLYLPPCVDGRAAEGRGRALRESNEARRQLVVRR